jgi:hypothetical protein
MRASVLALWEPHGMNSMTSSIGRHWRAWACLLALASGGFSAAAQPVQRQGAATNRPNRRVTPGQSNLRVSTPETNGPASTDYAAFKLITDRNIFNASRTPMRGIQRAPVVETAGLSGTMKYGQGEFAFFEGSSADYTKTLQAEGTIAGFKVLNVASGGVKLEAGTNTIDLPVGYQLRRVDGGEWQVAMITDSSFPSGGPNGGDFGRGRPGDQGPGFGRAPRTQDLGGGQGGNFNRQDRQGGRNQPNSRPGGSINFGSSSALTIAPSRPAASSGPPDPNVLLRLQQAREQELKGTKQ